MNRTDCLSDDQLNDYAQGILPDEHVEGVERHLEHCSICSDRIDRLATQGDPVTSLLQTSALENDSLFLDEPEYSGVLQKFTRRPVDVPEYSRRLKTAVETPATAISLVSPSALGWKKLGPYLLGEVIGRGGMGTVYKAQHQSLRTTVAVKLIQSHRFQDPKTHERFRREMEAAGKILHPNVVQARDAGEFDGIHFLTMEFVDGRDLSALLKRHEKLSVGHACEMIRMAAMGLQAIHQAGMVHRDLKPGNIMLARDGQVKILDLGLALLQPQHSTSAEELTSTGQLMGTVDYMSPEQADDTHAVDFRADIYGLGATLFALLTGRSPLGDKNQSLMKKLSFLANKAAPSVQSIREDVPDRLAEIVSQMLNRDPADRFSDVGEVVQVLTPFASATSMTDLLPEAPLSSGADANWFGDPLEDTIVMDSAGTDGEQTSEHYNLRSRTWNRIRDIRKQAMIGFGIVLIVATSVALLRESGTDRNKTNSTNEATNELATNERIVVKAPESADDKVGNREVSPNSSGETKRVAVAALQAIAAMPVEQLSHADFDGHWKIFSSQVEPDVRTNAIHQAIGVIPVELILHRLLTEESPSIRAGLLMAISEFSQAEVFESSQSLNTSDSRAASIDLIDTLLHWYVDDPDAEVHSCVDLLLRRWGQQDMLQKLRPLVEQKLIPFDGGWYQPFHVSAMVVITGPVSAMIGSPAEETGRFSTPHQNEDLRDVTVPHTFAISSTEVTRYQFWRVDQDYWKTAPPLEAQRPINSIPWRNAAEFCNRLSELEGIPSDQHCYVAIETNGNFSWRQKDNALQLTGYRLPTDEEWEIACRASTSTVRPFGNDLEWLTKYVHGEQPDGTRLDVGSLKPNAFGLFDMLGNVSEWIHSDPSLLDAEKGIRRVRGGSAWTLASGLRSAARYYSSVSPKVGFRVARTLVRKPFLLPPSNPRISKIELDVGPPACPAELTKFAGETFEPLLNQQIVQIGNWNVSNVLTRRFRIRNPTDATIELPHLPWMSNQFEFAPAPPLRIEANSAVEFGLRMALDAAGDRFHDLHFRWGKLVDIDKNEFEFPAVRVHGCFEGPLLEIIGVGRFGSAPQELNMGTVPVGANLGKVLYVINVGNRSTEAEVTGVAAPFFVESSLGGTIEPHTLNTIFRIGLDASTAGKFDGKVTVRSKQQPPVEFQFPIRAIVSESTRFSSIGLFRDGVWFIDHHRDGKPDEQIEFGAKGDHPLTGDWNGDGICDLAVWRPTTAGTVQIDLHLRGENPLPPLEQRQLTLESATFRPVAADRDGDGRTDIGYVLPQPERSSLVWRFDTAHDGQFADRVAFGRPDDDTVIGDWNGDGIDDLAVSRPGTIVAPGRRIWQLTWNGLAVPRELINLSPLDVPLAGDWDGDGDDEPAGWRPVARPDPSYWQFESDGDDHSNSDLKGFGVETDIPVTLRHRKKLSSPE